MTSTLARQSGQGRREKTDSGGGEPQLVFPVTPSSKQETYSGGTRLSTTATTRATETKVCQGLSWFAPTQSFRTSLCFDDKIPSTPSSLPRGHKRTVSEQSQRPHSNLQSRLPRPVPLLPRSRLSVCLNPFGPRVSFGLCRPP